MNSSQLHAFLKLEHRRDFAFFQLKCSLSGLINSMMMPNTIVSHPNRSTDEHWFGRGFEGIACSVTLFELVLGVFEVGVETEITFKFPLDVLAAFDLAQFINRWALSVTDRNCPRDGHRAPCREIRTPRDRTRRSAQQT